jgi:hypothetical protein
MATDSTDSSLHPYAPVDGHPRPPEDLGPEDLGIAADGVPDLISVGGSVSSVSLSSVSLSVTSIPA